MTTPTTGNTTLQYLQAISAAQTQERCLRNDLAEAQVLRRHGDLSSVGLRNIDLYIADLTLAAEAQAELVQDWTAQVRQVMATPQGR